MSAVTAPDPARIVIGLGGSRVARLRETAAALRAEFAGRKLPLTGNPSTGTEAPALAAYRLPGADPLDDSPDAYDAARFFADLRAASSPLIVALGPLAALPAARDACDTLIFIEVEERLSLLRWAELLMDAGSPGGVEALLYHESTVVPRYAAWSAQALARADLVLDDEDGPEALGSKIAWFARGLSLQRQGARLVPAAAVPGAPAAASAVPSAPGFAAPQAAAPSRAEAGIPRMRGAPDRARLDEALALERRLTRARAPNRLDLAWREFAAYRLYPAAKRGLDILAVSLVLMVAWPVFALVALLIWIDDPGPVIYTQKRVGRYGALFPFPKFRSMVRDADKLKDRLMHQNEMAGGVLFKMKRDPRVIPIGRTLRRFSLDELPQLFSILRGNLTLVGPRPPVPREVALYSSSDRRRLEATPGLTCIWQVSGRSDIPFPRQVELDVEYLEQRSLLLDLRILMATVPAVVSGRGAY